MKREPVLQEQGQKKTGKRRRRYRVLGFLFLFFFNGGFFGRTLFLCEIRQDDSVLLQFGKENYA